jgi:glutathione peroxidase
LKEATTIYDFTVKDLDGNDLPLSRYRGRVLIVINVASLCGLTKMTYSQLNDIYANYKDQGLSVIAFPCNQFNNQEPGSPSEIKEFLKKNDVVFDVAAKIEVNGENADPIYKWLKTKHAGDIEWNFTKFLVDRNGIPVKRYGPKTEPNRMEDDIVRLLATKSSL